MCWMNCPFFVTHLNGSFLVLSEALRAAMCLVRVTVGTPRRWPKLFRSTTTPWGPCTSPELHQLSPTIATLNTHTHAHNHAHLACQSRDPHRCKSQPPPPNMPNQKRTWHCAEESREEGGEEAPPHWTEDAKAALKKNKQERISALLCNIKPAN